MRSFRLCGTELPPRHLLFQECPALGVTFCLIRNQKSKLFVNWFVGCLEYVGRVFLPKMQEASEIMQLVNWKRDIIYSDFKSLFLKLSLFPKCGLAAVMCIFNTSKWVWREEVKEVKPRLKATWRVSFVGVCSILYIFSVDKVFPAIVVNLRI